MSEVPVQVCMEDKAVLLLPGGPLRTLDLIFFAGALP